MKHLITALALTVAAAGVFAADAAAPAASKTMSASQQKMADCSAANKGKKGDDYKSSQKACLSGTAAPAAASAPMTQQQKMAACSKQNKGKKGDDYKSSQKACLAA